MFNFKLILIINSLLITICTSYLLKSSSLINFNISIIVKNYLLCSELHILRDNEIIQKIKFDENYGRILHKIDRGDDGFTLENENGKLIDFKLKTIDKNFVMFEVNEIYSKDLTVSTCFDLESKRLNWYGGPQQKYQYWPIQKLKFNDYSYITKESDNAAITERYWLNSNGFFIYVHNETPLFISQNSNNNTNDSLCLIGKKKLPYDQYTNEFNYTYIIGASLNARNAHMNAIKFLLKKPIGIPDTRMIEHPIWSTWAKYKRDINETIVLEFADEIIKYKFNNSQYEIDDDWEVCYGSLTFNQQKFPNIKNLTNELKRKGFRVTLWIHPFININCDPWYTEAKLNGYLVKDHRNNTDTQWWNSKANESSYVDFTNPIAAKWFSNRLHKLLEETGIDSFKFDAGESSWSPPDPILNGQIELHPSLITIDYIRTVGKFGKMVEVRSGQGTQDLPIYLRMIDKDSNWDFNNGLPTLVTTLLQLNMVGYSFILPDMIGGNGYDGSPSKQMFIRWLAANVFMPCLQFSYVPWDYDNETIQISSKFTKLHEKYSNVIIERFKLAVKTGEPVNPPIWWIDTNDKIAQTIDDQFLLGDNLIAAPVLNENQWSRNIYLPIGKWRDGNNDTNIYKGPIMLKEYPVPLDVIPYFTRV